MKATYKLSKQLQKRLKEMTNNEVIEFGKKLGIDNDFFIKFKKPFQVRCKVSYVWAETIIEATK